MNENIEQEVTRGGLGAVQMPKSYPFATEVITLPSEGLCYPESSPLSKGQLTIKLLTAKEKILI